MELIYGLGEEIRVTDHRMPLVNAAAGFRRARRRALLALMLLGADWVVGTYIFADLHTKLEDVRAWALLVAFLSVGVASLGMFLAAWRCPVCHRWLGFSTPGSVPSYGGSYWWRQAACARCGTVFVDAPSGTGDSARDQREQIEAAVKEDAKHYRIRAELELFKAIVLATCGIGLMLIGIFLFAGPEKAVIVAIGALVFAGGLVWRRQIISAQERERRFRLTLEKR